MSDDLGSGYDVEARREAWRAFVRRLFDAFTEAKDAIDGAGVIDADRFVDLGGDAMQAESLERLSPRQLVEVFRHVAGRIGGITEQVFPGAPDPLTVRAWAEEMGVSGLVALARYTEYDFGSYSRAKQTVVMTSDDSTTVAVALMFTGSDA